VRSIIVGVAAVAAVGCKSGKQPPLREAIAGTWEVWCYTPKDTAECLGKQRDGLRKTFHADGRLEVRRPDDDAPSSDEATWILDGDQLAITISGGGITLREQWRARIAGDRLVLWDAASDRGQVLGRVGATFAAGSSPTTKGGPHPITLNGQRFTIALPAGYRMTRDDETKQWWAPTSGAGFEVHLSVSPRVKTQVDGAWITPPCNDRDYGGVTGSSSTENGVEREVSIGISLCVDPGDVAISCSAEHTRGYLEPSEMDAALALCKSMKR
jgi:hypothetical protein